LSGRYIALVAITTITVACNSTAPPPTSTAAPGTSAPSAAASTAAATSLDTPPASHAPTAETPTPPPPTAVAEPGTSWTAIPLPKPDEAFYGTVDQAIATPQGYFAVGAVDLGVRNSHGFIWTSADGVSWKLSDTPFADVPVHRIAAWNGTLFVAGAAGTHVAIFRSTDGTAWERVPDSPAFALKDAYLGGAAFDIRPEGDGLVVIARAPCDCLDLPTIELRTTNGVDWTRDDIDPADPPTLNAPIEGGDGWLRIRDVGAIFSSYSVIETSADRHVWRTAYGASGTVMTALTRLGSTYVAAGGDDRNAVVVTSTDGLDWKPVDAAALDAGRIVSLAAAGDGLIGAGDHLGRASVFISPALPLAGPEMRLEWQAGVGDEIDDGLAANGDTIFAGSLNGHVKAFDAHCATGGGECDPRWTGYVVGLAAGPLAATDKAVYAGTNDGHVVAFDSSCTTATCAPVWVGIAGPFNASPVAVGGGVVVGSAANPAKDGQKISAFSVECGMNSTTCSPVWTYPTPGFGISTPVVGDGVVFAADGEWLYALDPACGTNGSTCSLLWKGRASGATATAAGDGLVFAFAADQAVDGQGQLSVFPSHCAIGDAQCAPSAVIDGPFSSRPAISDGVFYVGREGGIAAYSEAACIADPVNCAPLWVGAATPGSFFRAPPAVADGVVYVGSEDGNVYAFAIGCGQGGDVCAPIGVGRTNGIVRSTPVVNAGMVFVGALDGHVYAFDAVVP
jgi:outer membrane protein assembly factor BamB